MLEALNGRMVQLEMDLLVGISFAMNLQMSSNHLVFSPNVTSNMTLNCSLVLLHSIVASIALLLQNYLKFVVNSVIICRRVGSSPVAALMGLQ